MDQQRENESNRLKFVHHSYTLNNLTCELNEQKINKVDIDMINLIFTLFRQTERKITKDENLNRKHCLDSMDDEREMKRMN